MAWWPESNAAVERAIEEWTTWTSKATAADAQFGSGSRNDRIRWFRVRLALWAKSVHETWPAAASALDCDEKTLRQDAARLDER